MIFKLALKIRSRISLFFYVVKSIYQISRALLSGQIIYSDGQYIKYTHSNYPEEINKCSKCNLISSRYKVCFNLINLKQLWPQKLNNKMKQTPKFTEEQYKKHVDSEDGICIGCDQINYGDVKPDATEYECEACGYHSVMGFEQALIEDKIEISEEEVPEESEEETED